MGRLHQPRQFCRGNQCHVAGALPAHDYHFLVIDDTIQSPGQVAPQTCVSSFDWHETRLYCTGNLYVATSARSLRADGPVSGKTSPTRNPGTTSPGCDC